MFINFSDLPGFRNLYLDYLYEFENVEKYYKINFRDRGKFQQHFNTILENRENFGDELYDIITDQYKNLEPSEATLKNAAKLKNRNTLAVVTGQQLGILGGPLYTFYKIITAIKLAEHYSDIHDDYDFVPVFWLAGDDHDFEEVKSVSIIDDGNDLKEIVYPSSDPEENNKGSVGDLKFDSTINEFFDNLSASLRDTEFKEPMIEKLRNIYKEGKTFNEAFAELIYSLFDKKGLVIFNPQDDRVKQLLKPVFLKELDNYRDHTAKLISVSAELEEFYHAQVKVKPVNLFMNYQGGRYTVEPTEDQRYRLRRKKKKFEFDELKSEITNNPELFSPNVLLRPIAQDHLFPTAFYVAGPGEINYFAQVTPLYEMFGLIPPVIYPRASATILEKNVHKVMEKYDLKLLEFFVHGNDIAEKIIKAASSIDVDEEFNEADEEVKNTFEKLQKKLGEFDKTMADAGDKYLEKILHYIEEYKEKAIEAYRRKSDTAVNQGEKALQLVMPNGSLQERALNYFYFANKYGPELIDKIYHDMDITQFEHQILNV